MNKVIDIEKQLLKLNFSLVPFSDPFSDQKIYLFKSNDILYGKDQFGHDWEIIRFARIGEYYISIECVLNCKNCFLYQSIINHAALLTSSISDLLEKNNISRIISDIERKISDIYYHPVSTCNERIINNILG